MDSRIETLAKNLVNYSCKVKPGENVLINYTSLDTTELVKQLIKKIYEAGANPFVKFEDPSITRAFLMNCNEDQIKLKAEVDKLMMGKMDCYIGIGCSDNISELSDVPSDKLSMYQKLYSHEVHHNIRVEKTKWVVLRYPNGSMAQLANMSKEAFESFYFKVCNLDYQKMDNAMQSLVLLMNKTDKVRLYGPGTDLSFSIKGFEGQPCSGKRNIPDGEVYTAPIKNSVNGIITYNTPSIYQGYTYENISLEFKDGKIIKATANNTEKINNVFDTDEGARYIGEFAIGVNPYILKPMKDTLFDEKIMGSIHFTPGRCYTSADNGNESAIHWDLVLIQTPEYGGGEIYFDDVLIRKEGRFTIPELECLNPENLI